MALGFISLTSWATFAAEAALVGIVYLICYRLFFHPLAKIPGPFLPATTRLYLWYHNAVKEGLYYKKIDDMHDKYGPVVRVAPNEIHLADPDHYDKIYSVNSKFNKDPLFYDALGMDIMITAITNDEHRRRRGPLNHFFSRRAIVAMEDIVQEKVNKLCRRIRETLDAGKPFNLRTSARAVTVDILTQYAFDNCWNHLDEEDFAPWFSEAAAGTITMFWTFQQFPPLLKLMQMIPEDYSRNMSPAMNGYMDCIMRSREYVIKVHDQIGAGVKPKRRTIFHELLDPSETDEEKSAPPSLKRLCDEAFGLCNAAAESTGNAIEMAAYHVITSPDIYSRLKGELHEAFPDPNAHLDYSTLEKLPYLTGVVKEGLRLSFGALGRLPRIVPEGGATFNGYFLPAGTTVSMSAWTMHRNTDVFPFPDTFDPTRWIDADEAAVRRRNRCLVPFSRGSRICIGQNLAMCEIYVMLGTFFHRFNNLVAFDVGPEDMEHVDLFAACHPKNSRPFKVAVDRSS